MDNSNLLAVAILNHSMKYSINHVISSTPTWLLSRYYLCQYYYDNIINIINLFVRVYRLWHRQYQVDLV